MNGAGAVTASATPSLSQFAEDVRYYLSLNPRQLPSKYLYDSLGSALFEAITQLPWYSLTRAEARLLATHAAEIFSAIDQLRTVLELGPGSGDKLLTLIRARAADREPLDVRLIDVSPSALARAAGTIGVTSGISVTTYEDAYEAGLERFRTERRGGQTLALFLGSNLGNFDPPGCDAFLRNLRAALRPCDALLLGADLVKPKRDLIVAYDDPLGVTAAFNRNLLVRMNRELGADFDLHGFAHRAVWNGGQSRVEMHLVSQRLQRVRIRAADLALRLTEGETIWTESSYKYRPHDVTALLDSNGFRTIAQWVDTTEPFALTLSEVR